METPASIKKHPLHPILVTLPIGLWMFSLAADVIFKMNWGPPVWRDVAYYCLAGGIVGALIAAVPGLIDLLSLVDPEKRRAGIVHMLIMLASVGVFAINFLIRSRGADANENLPFLLSIAGVVLISVGGWIGGKLVHVQRVSVEEPEPVITLKGSRQSHW